MMVRIVLAALTLVCQLGVGHAAVPECSRTYTLALHDHGLLYSAATDSGIDKDVLMSCFAAVAAKSPSV
jgi:polar amino acid transport system substrate-binding protein